MVENKRRFIFKFNLEVKLRLFICVFFLVKNLDRVKKKGRTGDFFFFLKGPWRLQQGQGGGV